MLLIFFDELLTAALCADALAASFIYGADRVKIPPCSALIITSLSTLFLFVSLCLGNAVSGLLPPRLLPVLCFLILFGLGIFKLSDSAVKSAILKGRDRRKNLCFSFSGLHFILTVYADPGEADADENSVLSPAEALSVGVAMSLDSAAAGLGAGFSDFPLVPTLLAVFLAGAAAVRLGCALGTILSRRVNLELSWVSGVMLIVLAVGKLL